jgi:DMSO/TMAO reductase YedYZ heme-binding membrane subunit
MFMDLNKKAIGLILINVFLFIVVFVFFILTPVQDGFDFFIRFGALFGFTAMFIATTMSPFMVQLYKIFGKSFIKLHHIFSIFGLIMITLHPVMFAISRMDIAVFIPDVSSWISFWELAGRPAFFIIYIAALAAILRKSLQKYWRAFHFLNYIALLFVYIHGVLIGTDFQNPVILILFSAMLIISIGSFTLKRYQTYSRKQRLKKKKEEKNE